jgi:hypothetical protein
MSALQTFNCPNCGGHLRYSGAAPSLTCQYCGSQVAVPDELRAPALQLEAQQTAGRYGRYLIIFILLAVGVPTCLGLAGSFIGLAAGILVPLITIFTSFFLHH